MEDERAMRWLARMLLIVWGMALLGAPGPALAQGEAFDLDALSSCAFAVTAPASLGALDVGAVMLNLATGDGCAENLDTPIQMASVPKIFVAGAFLSKVARGELTFNTVMTFSADYYMGGRNACLTANMIGRGVTYGYLSDIMISCSDNSATWMLMDVMGWDAVQQYIDSLGIAGIGPVIPYSEVDRLKLTLLDERWARVPRGLASQYLRNRSTSGLVPAYFDRAPDYSREQRIAASAEYMAAYDTNTATPRAIAQYFLKLRDDLRMRPSTPEGQAAWWLMNTLLLTQRQYSAQAFPGGVYVGAKNGFDTGVRAEASVLFEDLFSLQPSGLALIFARQPDLGADDFDAAGPTLVNSLTEYFDSLSPRIAGVLGLRVTPPPAVSFDTALELAVVNRRPAVESCARADLLNDIAACWSALTPGAFRAGDALGLGMIWRRLVWQTQRLTFVFTAPDGRQYSYQWTVAEREETHLFWYHVVDVAGTWRIDVYKNLRRIYSDEVVVG